MNDDEKEKGGLIAAPMHNIRLKPVNRVNLRPRNGPNIRHLPFK